MDNTEEVTNSTAELLDAYPKVFQGLGEFGEPYCIKLVPDAVPHAIFTPRRIPIPYREKVKEELSRMEERVVISRVDGPTKWCSGMVAIPKKNGAVRICVDLQKLNKSVLREVHPLPRVDETLGLLAGATVFSKFDANSGFWQIPLAEESRPLTIYIPHSIWQILVQQVAIWNQQCALAFSEANESSSGRTLWCTLSN